MKSETRELTFVAPRTVRYGEKSVELSKFQFSLLSYLYGRGKVTIAELGRHVWGRRVSYRVLSRVYNAIDKKLVSADIPYIPRMHWLERTAWLWDISAALRVAHA
jgi:hypothetical protein